jgi:hypothetical protein
MGREGVCCARAISLLPHCPPPTLGHCPRATLAAARRTYDCSSWDCIGCRCCRVVGRYACCLGLYRKESNGLRLVPTRCDDGSRNGDEAGVDCGGSCPNRCGNIFSGHPAVTPASACSNGYTDYQETGKDCGGPLCAPCGEGKACKTNLDCATGLECASEKRCVKPTAGGVNRPAGAPCYYDAECASGYCQIFCPADVPIPNCMFDANQRCGTFYSGTGKVSRSGQTTGARR